MTRQPLDLSLPFHQVVFQTRQEFKELKGLYADTLHALQNNVLEDREGFESMKAWMKSDLQRVLQTLRQQESQLDPAYRMQHDDVV